MNKLRLKILLGFIENLTDDQYNFRFWVTRFCVVNLTIVPEICCPGGWLPMIFPTEWTYDAATDGRLKPKLINGHDHATKDLMSFFDLQEATVVRLFTTITMGPNKTRTEFCTQLYQLILEGE